MQVVVYLKVRLDISIGRPAQNATDNPALVCTVVQNGATMLVPTGGDCGFTCKVGFRNSSVGTCYKYGIANMVGLRVEFQLSFARDGFGAWISLHGMDGRDGVEATLIEGLNKSLGIVRPFHSSICDSANDCWGSIGFEPKQHGVYSKIRQNGRLRAGSGYQEASGTEVEAAETGMRRAIGLGGHLLSRGEVRMPSCMHTH